jgi:two-component system, sensor histidine kinase
MNYLQKELYNLVQSDASVFEFLQAGSLDGIWYWDLEKQENEWISDRFWELLGHDPDAMPHRADAWQELNFSEDLDMAIKNFMAHCDDPDHPYDQMVRYRHKQGHTITVRCRGIAIRNADGKAVRMLGAHTDLTDLKRTESALRDTNTQLQEARDAAQTASDAKTAFLATISHEVRNPLNGILGMADVLARSTLSGEQLRMIEVIQKSGEHLLSLTNDMLDLSRIEAGAMRLDLEPFDVADELDTVVRLHRVAASQRGIDLSLDCPSDLPQVRGSAKALRQIVTNLVTNALKFTDRGSIKVAVDLVAHTPPQGNPNETGQPKLLRVSVADSGCGVPDERKQSIFERYETLNSPAGFAAGIGLGLPIARRLADLHGGCLSVSDTVGGGSTFEASLVVHVEAGSSSHRQTAAPAVDLGHLEAPLRLLIAEDNAMNRFVLTAMLEGAHVDLTFVENGAEALESAQSGDYDGALFDIKMPIKDGDAALRELRADEARRGRPRLYVVALSANTMADQVAGYQADGFNDHLAKPLSLASLTACLRKIVATTLDRKVPKSA